ncbi:MAG TPA: hypothetical protein VN767_15595 [Streptosporangiaceae bacterium]|nr:hypothetical protein [Streptosporangiaceae bacterium]
MGRRQVLVLAAGAAAMWGAGLVAVPGQADARVTSTAVGMVKAAGSWGKAVGVPGLGALNKGGRAAVSSVTCGSAGNCSAGGFYTDGHAHQQGFVINELNGRWGKAVGVPGLGALNKDGKAGVNSTSCGSAGNCSAGGFYTDGHGHQQGFVVTELHGRWGRAVEVPGLGALNKGGIASVSSVSCPLAGTCVAGGSYNSGSGQRQAFVATRGHGHWQAAIALPGMATLAAGQTNEVLSVSCAKAGGCAAAGRYVDSESHQQGFVASEKNGVWGQAIEVPGLGLLNAGASAQVSSVSCGSPSSCSAGGDYRDNEGNSQGFVVDEKNGVWGQAIEAPGLAALNSNGDAGFSSMSCPAAGQCAAGGDYDYDYNWGFLIRENNGTWGQAINPPGLGSLAFGRFADVDSVSCASAGNCAAGGDYEDLGDSSVTRGFVINERNGVWGKAVQVPGLAALEHDRYAFVVSVSCGSAGKCVAVGDYADGHGHQQGFLVGE